MRTISWKHPLIALFIGSAIVVACSDDEPTPTPEEAGTLCGNGKVDEGEKCDPKKLRSCSDATMGSKPTGTTKCNEDCTKEDVSGCKAAGGAGGGGGMGGGTGGSVGGTGGGPSSGGKPSKDSGADAPTDTGTTPPTPEAGKPDSGGGSGGAGGAGGTPVDSGKD